MKEYTYTDYFNDLTQPLRDTQHLLDLVNENNDFNAHLSTEPVNLSEPFGAILWHRRQSMDYPLCVASSMCQIDMMDMIKIELGWAMPKENYKQIMETLYIIYGFTPREWEKLYQKGIDYQNEKPMDLSYYLGIDLPDYFKSYRPADIYGMAAQPLSYIRRSIEVVTQKFTNGVELPKKVIWNDGRVFSIDKIDIAQEAARFKTGGVGTRFSCWLKGQQRNICFENRGRWFVETPRYAL